MQEIWEVQNDIEYNTITHKGENKNPITFPFPTSPLTATFQSVASMYLFS